MYCSHCRRQLFYRNPEDLGWCDDCRSIVHVTRCKVSYWFVVAVFVILWSMPGNV